MLHKLMLLFLSVLLAALLLPLGEGWEREQTSAAETQESPPLPAKTLLTPAPQTPKEEEETGQSPAEESTGSEEPPPEPEPADTVSLLLEDGTVTELSLEDYLWGVTAAEMPASFPLEALKAQAVAARSYALYQLAHPDDRHPSAQLCTSYLCCQAWISREERLAGWPESDRELYAQKLEEALDATRGESLSWQGEPVLAVFHACSAGRTRSSESVWGTALPYLVSVDSPEDQGDTPNYYSRVTMTPEEFSAKLKEHCPEAVLEGSPESWVTHTGTDDSGGLTEITIGGVQLTAQQLRSIFALRSASVELSCSGEEIVFYVTGYGHGVGMSQYGASAIAEEGADYREILSHYYPGTQLIRGEKKEDPPS